MNVTNISKCIGLLVLIFFISCSRFNGDKKSKKVIKSEKHKPACSSVSLKGKLIIAVKCLVGQPVCGTLEGEETDPQVYCVDKDDMTLKSEKPYCQTVDQFLNSSNSRLPSISERWQQELEQRPVCKLLD